MTAKCPQCGAKLDVPFPGSYECSACRQRVEVTDAFGLPEAVTVPPAPEAAPDLPGAGASVPPSEAPSAFRLPPSEAPSAFPLVDAPCARHPGNAARSVCERCGDFMCSLCTTPVEGRIYCPGCFDLLYNRGAFGFTRRRFTMPGTTLALGIGAFLSSLACFCLMVAVPLAIGGLAAGLKGLKEHREHPDLPQRNLTVTGIVFSSLALLVSVAQVIFWAVALSSRH